MRIVLALACLFWLVDCAPQPGATLPLSSTSSASFGGTTKLAREIVSPFPLQAARGRRLLLDMAYKGDRPLTLLLAGATPSRFRLQPNRWNHLEISLQSTTVDLEWQGPPLVLAEPYMEPKGRIERTNVLLISIDTLRGDFFSEEHMPELYGLFQQGVIFDRIYTPTPWTLPAHASLLTGMYPSRHGVRRPDDKLSDATTTLGDVFQAAGYYSLAVTEGNYMSALHGLNKGMHHYYENPPLMMNTDPASISKLEANIKTLVEEGARLGNIPKFFFFHTYEVHCPYVPRENLEDKRGEGLTSWLLDHDGGELEPDSLTRLKRLYAGEVAYTDQLLSPLVRSLLASGNWLIALVSDHGEEFGEHGGLLHADTLYEEATHIPFAMVGEGVPTTGSRPVLGSLVDVAPTLLKRLGFDIPTSWSGRDLLEPNPALRAVFSESFFFGPQIEAREPRLMGTWLARDKLIQHRNFGRYRAELFDLDADPEERRDLSSGQPEKRDGLFLLIQNYMQSKRFQSQKIEDLPPEQLEVLRSLGYIQ